MQVDPPLHQHFPLPGPSFDDFFNMEMASPSSRSPSSRSPSPRSPILPILPPAYSNPQIATQDSDPDSFFNFYLEDEFKDLNTGSNINMGLGLGLGNLAPPYDFFSALPSSSSSSDSASPISLANAASPPFTTDSSQLFTIDPQLVGTPSTSKALSEFDDDDEEEEEAAAATVQPVKVAGHGKLRKGTVQSGGISKPSSSSTASRNKENAVVSQVVKQPSDSKNDEDDDWRPTPEEYKKMSSKEKRQLRNKISARNFRVRRKEYISTLEADISERDRLLDAIRSELGSTQSENVALRQEIAALKRSLLAGRGVEDTPVLPPPGPLPTSAPTSAPTTTTTSTPLPTANTHKDLGVKNKAFWGGVGGGMGMGGITSVHTAIIPELNVGLGLNKRPLMENLNPALNAPQNQGLGQGQRGVEKVNGFEGFMDRDMFTMKSLDSYRMQLWGKMAAQHNAHQQQQTQPKSSHIQTQPPPHLTGLASNMRPQFFHGQNVGLSGMLSGKAPLGSKSMNVPISSSPVVGGKMPTQEQAVLAAMASQTLLGKLGSAFWDAFSGSSSSSSTPSSTPGPNYFSNSKTQAWDAEKVRRVLEGKAVVKVVDVEPVKAEPKWEGTEGKKCEWEKCVHDLLEENFRSLSLGKKA